MGSFTKILSHPDKNTIVRMLTQGQGVRAVSRYLREKYPDNKNLQISVPTLQSFRKQKLNIEGEALEAIKQAGKERQEIKEAKKEDTKLRNLPAYKDKLKEIVDYHVDIQNELKELLVLVKARIEDLFDRAGRGELTTNEEMNLQRYFQLVTVTIERWAKYIEKIADRTIETTNVNITIIEDQMSIMREAIRDVIAEMDPELAIRFLDKLNNKMTALSYKRSTTTFKEIKDDAHILTATVEGMETHDD